MTKAGHAQAPLGGEYYVFRDAVHNLIAVENEAEGKALRRVLRTPEVQRLRRIRQNGLASLVYTGMETSRFAHALGTYHVARRLMNHLTAKDVTMPPILRPSQRLADGFCLAGLLHDVGHAPFSHVWEEYALALSSDSSFNHEVAGRRIIEESEKLGTLLDDPTLFGGAGIKEDILGLLGGSHPVQYLVRLLSGPLDVDRLDYMARDTRAAGVTYGFHELDWILRSLRFARLPGQDVRKSPTWIVAIDGRKGLTTLAQFLYARANMYRLVYHHKTIRAAGCMLVLMFLRYRQLVSDPKTPNEQKPPCHSPALSRCLQDPHKPSLTDYLELDDSDVWTAVKGWSRWSDPILSDLARRLLSRDLYKVIELDDDVHRVLQKMENEGRHLSHRVAILKKVDQSLAGFFYRLDMAKFNLVGTQTQAAKDVYILERGRFGQRFRTLRQFWVDEINAREADLEERKHILVAHPEVVTQLANLVNQLRSKIKIGSSSIPVDVSPRQQSTSGNAEVPDAPDGFTLIQPIVAPGASKQVYLGAAKELSPGVDLFALKRYKGTLNIERDLDAPGYLLSQHAHVSHTLLAKGKGNWLIEPLWSGSVLDLLEEQGPLRNLDDLFSLAEQLFSGLTHIHAQKLRHTDIKPENCGVFLEATGPRFVIGDFGCLSSTPDVVPASPESFGTIRTRPPELFSQPPHIGLKSDVWSLGATIYAVATWCYPFIGLKEDVGSLQSESRLAVEDRIRRDLKSLLDAYSSRLKDELPPCVSEPLSACFLPLEHRLGAAEIHQRLQDAQAGFRVLKNKNEYELAPFAWQIAEDTLSELAAGRVVTESTRPQLAETLELLEKLSVCVPPRVLRELREIRKG